MSLKNGSGKCSLFVLSTNGWKEQNWWTLRFSAEKKPNMEKPLFDWPIELQYDVKAISRKFFGHEVFSAERSLNQPKARCVCIRSINQSNRFISVRLLFLFCSRVFISRSYENRSISNLSKMLTFTQHTAKWQTKRNISLLVKAFVSNINEGKNTRLSKEFLPFVLNACQLFENEWISAKWPIWV